jgi:hypothetical protein
MLISRRTALARGAAMLAGLYTATSADAATTGIAYQLKTGKHCHCKACEHHAANKLFTTRRAADKHRAHTGCKCTIARVKVDAITWAALFGAAGAHTVVDRRWSSTKQSLRRAAKAAKAAKATKARKTHRTKRTKRVKRTHRRVTRRRTKHHA